MKKGFNKRELGDLGESLAVSHLEKAGLKIVKRNYRCPKGEIDIIAQERELMVFVEVRLRTSGFRGYAEESINPKKAYRLQNIAAYYLLQQGVIDWPPVRFDIVAINWEEEKPEIRWIQAAL
ncbi:MAG: hypothetical protein APF84_12630 [Gracilibacter sp. BRH_c7a]|nr:MAG: hypothetical protein APF84_12630 [Gracilibacter sp. BRH_c7a]